jgi:MoxR-like ATPase
VAARVAQCDVVLGQMGDVYAALHQTAEQVRLEARGHDWLPPSWLAQIESIHDQRCEVLQQWLSRLQLVRQGFSELPRNEDADAAPPEPVMWASP